jgi:hypothetical protein
MPIPVTLADLIPTMRQALESDQGNRKPSISLAALLPRILDALKQDGTAAETDLQLATQVRDAIPLLTSRISELHEASRRQLSADSAWALTALDWQTDLLSPLGKQLHEPTHTRVLAFLLDPRQNHGLGVRVLREFFALLGRMIPGPDRFEDLARETDANTEILRRVRVKAEHIALGEGCRECRCDLWLELEDSARSLAIVIENKIDSAEHDNQLAAYEEAVWGHFRERRRLNFDAKLVFLTPDGRAPDQDYDRELWLPMSYLQLAAALARATRDAPEPGRTLLNLYISSILKFVLAIPAAAQGLERLRQLPYFDAFRLPGELP